MTTSIHSSKRSSLEAVITAALQTLDALEAELNLNIVVRPNDKSQMRALARVSDAALGLASDIVTSEPARFPDFAMLPVAASYVETMGRLALRMSELTGHVQNSILNQRTPAAERTLVLYEIVKGLGRIADNETMREKVALLQEEIAPKRPNARPKQTQAERNAKAVAKRLALRVAKAQRFLAENQPAVAAETALN